MARKIQKRGARKMIGNWYENWLSELKECFFTNLDKIPNEDLFEIENEIINELKKRTKEVDFE